MKQCYSCKVEKPSSEFAKNKARPDGLGAYCKDCSRKKAKANRIKRLEIEDEIDESVEINPTACNNARIIRERIMGKSKLSSKGIGFNDIFISSRYRSSGELKMPVVRER